MLSSLVVCLFASQDVLISVGMTCCDIRMLYSRGLLVAHGIRRGQFKGALDTLICLKELVIVLVCSSAAFAAAFEV